MKKYIPSIITSLSILAGCIGLVAAFNNILVIASLLIFAASVLDFLDGFAARLLNAQSEFGKQLDSLADLISFGVLPAVIIYKLITYDTNGPVIIVNHTSLIPFIAFFITIFSALRLAKFNIDEKQAESFLGLPTPASAILIASFPLIIKFSEIETIINILTNFYFLVSIPIIISFLLISNIPLFSLKFKSFAFNKNKTRYIFLFISLILIVFLQFIAIPLIIFTYIILSIINIFACKEGKREDKH